MEEAKLLKKRQPNRLDAGRDTTLHSPKKKQIKSKLVEMVKYDPLNSIIMDKNIKGNNHLKILKAFAQNKIKNFSTFDQL